MLKIFSERSWLAWVLAGAVMLALGLQVRLYPLYHNLGSDAYEEGTILVLAKLRAMVAAQLNAQVPEMPDEQKAALLNARVNEIMQRDKAQVRKAFDSVGNQLQKKAVDQKRYLQESDSYYFLSLTQNIIEKGALGPKTNGATYYNDLMLAPLGFWQPVTWHPYVGAAVYQLVRLFDPKADLMEGVSWTPLVLLPFIIAAFLFACRAMGCSVLPAFTAGMFFIFAQIYLMRSTYAWYDDDSYAVLFPALTLGFFFLALKHSAQLKKFLIYGSLCAISAALYSRFWPGWGYLWVLTAVSAVLIAGASFFNKDKRLPQMGILLAVLTGVTVLAVTLMIGLPQLFETVAVAWGELQKFTAPKLNGWPDLFVVVGELKKGSLQDMIKNTGGPIAFIGALTAFLWAGWDLLRKKKCPEDTVLTLGVFFVATSILSLSAQRFTMLGITPIALLFAYSLERLWRSRALLGANLKWPAAVLGAVLILITIIPYVNSSRIVRSLITPIFNSTWDRALTKLRTDSPPESIVHTWWSPGHFVKAIAERKVNFDGASINGEQGYWMTRVYLAQNETEALGILRMIDRSSNKAAEYLDQQNIPLSTTVPLLQKLTQLKKEEARRAISQVLPKASADELLQLTHGNGALPPTYVLIYQEIVEGNVLLGYVGKWNFAKIETLNSKPELLNQIPGKSSPDFISFLWSLAGGPYKHSPSLTAAKKNGDEILFEGGISLNTQTMTAAVNSSQFGEGVPASIVYYDEAAGQVVEKKNAGPTLSYSVVFYKDDGMPKIVLADRTLANSLLFKLYYFEGKGLKHFRPFAKERDLTGRTKVYIYEVSWPKDF